MPRAAGQIDRRKNEAILDAATTVLNQRGMAAPIETIARMAGVSKQTIYNHYGSKSELIRALIARRADQVTQPLGPEALQDVEGALTGLAEQIIGPSTSVGGLSMLRVMVAVGDEAPDLAAQIYAAGPEAATARLSHFLASASEAGLLDVPDPAEAAEYFIGMVMGNRHLKQLLRLPSAYPPGTAGRLSREAARRFMRAYAPVVRRAG
jgi:TetR/AcrR family transcriptional regulator, mexJK operon transcriptional repressor